MATAVYGSREIDTAGVRRISKLGIQWRLARVMEHAEGFERRNNFCGWRITGAHHHFHPVCE
jgi:hypothetical protein